MTHRNESYRLALLAIAVGLHPFPASAQTDSIPKPGNDLSVAMVISGGASLGVYEAGYMYTLGEVLKRQGIPLRVATGASAGSGNALFAALNSCTAANDFPTRDLGYRFWLAQQFDSLFQPDSSTAISAFIATPGLVDLRRLLGEVWQSRLPEWCDVSLGISVTRLTPLDVPLQGQLTVPRQLLYFTIRIRGRGDSLPPVIQNSVVSGSGAPQLLLPLAADPDADASQDRDRLVEVIAASGAFPFAFPPVTLAYCIYPAVNADACHEADHHDRFIDGGVFDNVPLGLAGELNRSNAPAPDQTRFVYLDPDLRAYPVPEPGAAARQPSVFTHGAVLAQGFVHQARKTELFALLEERSVPLDPGRLFIASSRFPQASGFLGNFFGLFEREFRRFDYYLGMYDALEDLASWDQLPSDRGRQALEALLTTPDWLPLQCLREWYDSTAVTPQPDCDADRMRDFRILAQIAMNRVYSQCRELRLEQRARPIANYHCRRAAEGALPPRIAEPALPLDSTRILRDSTVKETELDYNLRLLVAYGFHFRDLGVPREEASGARRVLARHLREVIEALADRQPTSAQRKAVRLGTLAVGYIYYEPPPSWWYLVVGTAQEIGGSTATPGLPDWLRLNAALRVEGIVSLLTRDPNEFAVGLFAGPDIELRPFTRLKHMITIAPRVGYQLAQGDRFHSKPCDAARTHGDGRDCSQVVLQAATSVIAFERVRLQVSLDYFTRKVDFDDRSYDVQIALGVQF
jgi:predicted acylesterase/phospholipase RssA